MNVLHVCANPKPTDEAVSKQLAAGFFSRLVSLNDDVEMVNVDLCVDPPPVYTYAEFRNFWYPSLMDGYVPTKEESSSSDYAYKQAQLFNAADVIVLTTPMWNYSVPAALKGWMDHVLAPGLTYEMGKESNTPLHKVKRLILLAASGDVLKESDPSDALTPLITAAFGQVGIEDIAMAWADGQNPLVNEDSEERKLYAIEAAEELAEEVAEIDG